AYVLQVCRTSGCMGLNTAGMKQGFLSQKGSGVGRGVKEKQVSIADKSVEGRKHVNVVNAGLESFITVSKAHGMEYNLLLLIIENMYKCWSEVGFKPVKQVYRQVSKKNNVNTSGNKKKDVEPTIEVSNSNPFDVLNSIENDVDLSI
ncbi:hypothetical protein Tco_1348220, partial [Tanacetum coccineum]